MPGRTALGEDKAVPKPIEVSRGIYLIDSLFAGLPRQCGAFLVCGDVTVLFDTGPSGTAGNILQGLESLGARAARIDYILLTHFHLDHAGAASLFLERWPEARVLVDERSAFFMSNPEKFLKSAEGSLGAIAPFYGTMHAMPEERIIPIADGHRLDLGGGRSLEAIHTPGHSGGHFAFFDRETRGIFCGDALGHYMEEYEYVFPATPAPQFSLEKSLASASRLAELEPHILFFPHFGASRRPGLIIEQFARQVRKSIELASDLEGAKRNPDELAEWLYRDLPAVADEEEGLLRGILRVNAAGVLQYLDRQGEAPQSR